MRKPRRWCLPPRRILLDECVDRGLLAALAEHEIKTVPDAGWASFTNGDLLGRAQAEFDIFITNDRNLMFQQNLPKFDIAVLVLAAKTNRLQDLLPLVPQILQALPLAKPGAPIVLES